MTRNAVDRYFTSVNSHDWAGLRGALAEDIIRIGPNGMADIVHGRDNYVAFNRKIIGAGGAYQGHGIVPHESLYSPDGRRAFVTATEWCQLSGHEKEIYHLLFVFDINDQDLLEKISIFWKTPERPVQEFSTAEGSEKLPDPG